MKANLTPHQFGITLIASACLTFLAGCAEYQVTRNPKPFKPTLAIAGVPRVVVAGELGAPVNSEQENGRLIETYKYVDGGQKNRGGMKTGRFVLYCAGDLFTLFFAQLVTWPTETYVFAGTTHIVTVDYEKSTDGFWRAKAITDADQGSDKAAELAPPKW